MDSKHDMTDLKPGIEDSKSSMMDSKQQEVTREDSPPPYLDATSQQTFTVNYASWRRFVTINDPTGQTLFTSHTKSSWSTRLEIANNNGQVIGSSKSSQLSSKIDVEMTNPHAAFEMHNSASVLGGSPGYVSPAFTGQKVVWKNKALSTNIIYTLVVDKTTAVARFESDWHTKIGKLELTHEAVGEQQLNEIVVTLLTLLQRKMRNLEASWIAAVT